MVSAQMYISTDVVERLTRPLPPPPSPDESLTAFATGYRSRGGRGGRGGSDPFGQGQGEGLDSEEDRERRRLSFNEFVARQTQMQMKRESAIKEVWWYRRNILFVITISI